MIAALAVAILGRGCTTYALRGHQKKSPHNVKNDDNHTAAAGAAAAAAASTITICGHDEALRVIFPKLAGNLAQLLLK